MKFIEWDVVFDYTEFQTKFPVLGCRLHRMHCDSCRPMGIKTWIVYTGDTINGKGRCIVFKQYGRAMFNFTVKDGILHAFGMKSSLYGMFKPRIYGDKQEQLQP